MHFNFLALLKCFIQTQGKYLSGSISEEIGGETIIPKRMLSGYH